MYVGGQASDLFCETARRLRIYFTYNVSSRMLVGGISNGLCTQLTARHPLVDSVVGVFFQNK